MAEPRRGEGRGFGGRRFGGLEVMHVPAPRFACPFGLGIYATPSTNPEGVALASRGREPTDTATCHHQTPKGLHSRRHWVSTVDPMPLSERSVAAIRNLECHPFGVWLQLLQ